MPHPMLSCARHAPARVPDSEEPISGCTTPGAAEGFVVDLPIDDPYTLNSARNPASMFRTGDRGARSPGARLLEARQPPHHSPEHGAPAEVTGNGPNRAGSNYSRDDSDLVDNGKGWGGGVTIYRYLLVSSDSVAVDEDTRDDPHRSGSTTGGIASRLSCTPGTT